MGGGMIGGQVGVGGIFGGSQLPGMGGGAGGGVDLFGGLGNLGPNPGVMFQGGPMSLPKQVFNRHTHTSCEPISQNFLEAIILV